MKISHKLELALTTVLIVSCATTPKPIIRAEASINVAGYNQRFSGLGNSDKEAVIALRENCASNQNIDIYKHQCKVNELLNLSYGSLPGGSYLKSCGLPYGNNHAYCRMEGATLVCSTCKPVMERRTLDMNQCPGDAYNNVSNCGGTLKCDGSC